MVVVLIPMNNPTIHIHWAYEDHANWGRRDNIVNPSHESVSIGSILIVCPRFLLSIEKHGISFSLSPR